MKTPDEIKKGLDCCIDGNIVCSGNCVFDDDVKLGYPDCVKLLMTNALALIQQLQAENAKKDETIQMLQDGNAHLMRMIDEECEKTVRLEAERDALMHWAKGRCDTCAHKYDCVKHDPDPEGYVMRWYDDCEIWEWRGVQKEETP